MSESIDFMFDVSFYVVFVTHIFLYRPQHTIIFVIMNLLIVAATDLEITSKKLKRVPTLIAGVENG